MGKRYRKRTIGSGRLRPRPADIIATQEIIWATRPDLIVETGVARGGSVLFMASILELIGKGKVVGDHQIASIPSPLGGL
jgi:cephalosporin hydroxylase